MADALMVTSSFLPGRGGIESYLAEVCSLLSPRVAVFSHARRERRELPRDLPYETIGYAGSLAVPTPRVRRAIVRAAAGVGTDRILFGTPWPLALLGPSLRRAGLRYAAIVHGAEVLVPGAVPALSFSLAAALAGADLLLPVSEFTGGRVAALLRRHRKPVPDMHVLRARVDLDRFRPDVDASAARARLGIAPAEKVVLCFGRLVRRKGVHRLIDALADIRAEVPDAVVVVAGTGPQEKRLRARARRAGGRVVFAGRVADEDAPALYALADVFALPVVDRYFGREVEGLGVVLLEAAAGGTPCVTGRSGGTPEAVADGVTGFVIDASDRAALATKVAWLLAQPAAAAEMGRAGRAHVAERFSGDIPEALARWLR